MPIYEYICEDCGEVHSELRAMKRRAELAVCPECGGWAVLTPSVPVPFHRGTQWHAKFHADGVGKPGRG
jgi:putative FmdB family regulatory protein